MERLTGIINGLVAQAKPHMARFGLPQEDWAVFAVVAGAILLLLILRVLFRSRSGGGGGTKRDLERHELQLSEQGVEHWKRPFVLIADRVGWKRLSEPYRWELVSRLQNSRNTIDFVKFAERAKFHKKVLPKIDQANQSEAAMAATASALLELGESKKKLAQEALSYAMMIEPKRPEVVLNRAAQHVAARQFDKAMPLLEAGIAMCQQRIETLQHWPTDDVTARHRLGELQRLAQDSAESYQHCLEQASPV